MLSRSDLLSAIGSSETLCPIEESMACHIVRAYPLPTEVARCNAEQLANGSPAAYGFELSLGNLWVPQPDYEPIAARSLCGQSEALDCASFG